MAQKEINNLNSAFSKIMKEYINAKKQDFAGHPMGEFVRITIPDIIYSTEIVPKSTHLISGSVGQGNWAMVPWICIFDRSITKSPTTGVYIAYLLSKDGKRLYLTLEHGCTDIRKKHTLKETIDELHKRTSSIKKQLGARGFNLDHDVNLGDDLTELARLYKEGIIFYKEYTTDNLPKEDELRVDLKEMMQVYKEYVDNQNSFDAKVKLVREKELTTKNEIDIIKKYIASKGFNFEEGLIENYYLSLKSKPFVILAGISGTGKTRLARLFAEAIGATTQNGRYKLVSVRPDWSDSTDLFGHVNLNDKFIPGAVIDFIKKAEEDIDNPYFLCLDEMNLARVEYYLSDILSIIETRDYVDGKIITEPLISNMYYGADKDAVMEYGEIKIPENLYFIGTVNMDETTFPFSKKVLDRANTIEFSTVDLLANFKKASDNVEPIILKNSFLKTEYIYFNRCQMEAEFVEELCIELEEINKILEKGNSHVGYRIRDEIVFYMLNNKKNNLLERDVAFDNEIMQKILPRIQGSSMSVRNMLIELFKHCSGDFESYQTESEDISSKMLRAIKTGAKYEESAQKIAFMVRRYEEDGFTTYWL